MKTMSKTDLKLVQFGEDLPWPWGEDGAIADMTIREPPNTSLLPSSSFWKVLWGQATGCLLVRDFTLIRR